MNSEGFRITNQVSNQQAVVDRFTWNDVTRSRHSLTASSRKGLVFDIDWLEKAAGVYRISANPEDYVFVQVKALTLDLPNRNLYNFTSQELSSFDPSFAMATYKTFVGKPTYAHHEQVLPKAKGAILGADMVDEGRYGYVVLTTAWDKRKDPKLTAKIGDPNAHTFYSMGCTAYQLVCSICGHAAPGKRNQCDHVKPPMRGTIIKGRLAYEDARKLVFSEQSVVDVPADSRASREGTGPFSQGINNR